MGSNTYTFYRNYSFAFCIQSSFGVTGNGFENGIAYYGSGGQYDLCSKSSTSDNTVSGRLFVKFLTNVRSGDRVVFGGVTSNSNKMRTITILAFE